MIKLKFLVEKNKKEKKKDKEPVYPEIIMLPDVVMERDRFVEFMKELYNADVKFEEKEEK